jgi:DNA repair ATPase RecN
LIADDKALIMMQTLRSILLLLVATLALTLTSACSELANTASGLGGGTYPDSRDPYYGSPDPYYGRDPYYRPGYGYGQDREYETLAAPPVDCAKINDRIRFDRQKIAEITPTGQHRKALQWYKDDLQNAERDRDQCGAYESYQRRQREQARHEEQRRQQAEIQRQHAKCQQIADRIRYDQAKITEITPTGQHRKALQWYKDDLKNAQRDMQACH